MNLRRLMKGILITFILFLPLSCSTSNGSDSGSPVEKPTDKTPEKPENNTVEKPVEKPSDSQTAERPVEKPVDEPDEKTVAESLESLSSLEDSAEALAVLEKAEELSFEERILKSALLMSEGRNKEARELLNTLNDEKPGHPDVQYNFALLENTEGNAAARDKAIASALKSDPVHEGALLLKGTVALNAKRYRDADKSFRIILKNDPENFMALSGSATAQMNIDELETAIKLLDRAIALEPEFAYLYVDRARAWRGLKNYGKAEDDYERAIELEPDVEWHYLDRARIRIQYFYNLEGAMEDLDKLEEINSDNFFANIYKAGILDEWNQFDEAERYYEKVIAARPNYGFAHEPLAKYAYMNGEYVKAKDHFLKAYEFESREVLYALAAALCMEKAGDTRKAKSFLKEVAPRVERNTLQYEMFRYYLNPGSNFFITDKINKETDEDLKSRMYFYLGARDDISGMRNSALASYQQVNDKTDFFESDLAAWELTRED